MASAAELIRQHEAEIMNRWLHDARAAASARGLSVVAMENIMPSYLAALANGLETDDLKATDRQRKHVQTHVSTRLRQGFDLAEIVSEFVLLERRRAIGEALPTLAPGDRE